MESISKASSSSSHAWLIWFVAGAFYLYEMVLRAGAGVMASGIMDTFFINATELGVLTSFYYAAYVIMQIPGGILVDRLGPRFVVTFSCILCAAGSYLFATTSSLVVVKIARFMVGAGSACAFISCLKIAVNWFEPQRFALIAGLTNMLGTLGGTFAGVPLAEIIHNYGWQKANLYFAFAGVAVTIACWMIIRDKPSDYKEKMVKGKKNIGIWETLTLIVFRKQILIAGCVGGLMYAPISSFAELWAVPFLMKSLDVSSHWSSFAASMIFAGVAIGSPAIAELALLKKSYTKMLKYSALGASFCFIFITFSHQFGYWPSFIFLFMAGFFTGGQVLCFSLVKENIASKISGTAMAYTNALVMLSGVVLQPLVGMILDLSWDGGSLNDRGARIYSVENYQHAIIVIPVTLLLAFILLYITRDKIPEFILKTKKKVVIA